MKLILYSFSDKEAKKFKEFLMKNNLPFEEKLISNPNNKQELMKLSPFTTSSKLLIKTSHGLSLYHYDEQLLNLNIIEHIKKYNIKFKDNLSK